MAERFGLPSLPLADTLRTPEHTLLDRTGFLFGPARSMRIVLPQLGDLDLVSQAARLDLPVFLVTGHDMNCVGELLERYYRIL